MKEFPIKAAIDWLETFAVPYEKAEDCKSSKDLGALYRTVINFLVELENRREGVWTLDNLQAEQVAWVQHNFKPKKGNEWHPFLGMVEEVGELSHAFLKMAQGIRGTREEHMTEVEDAIADTVIYMADFCSRMNINLYEVVRRTWSEVKQRDWKKFPKDGLTE